MLITFLFLVVLGRLLYIQVVSEDSLNKKALDQWTRDVSITGSRGYMYDANGEVLVSNSSTYTVYVRPVTVKNDEEVAQVLSQTLDVDYDRLLTKLKNKVSEVTVKKNVSKDLVNQLRSLNLSGVYYAQNIRRVYTYGNFLTQALGFTNVDGVGQSGLELYYNDYLVGKNGYVLTETDLVGRELDGTHSSYVASEDGNSIVLTVDAKIQIMVESAVKEAQQKYNAKGVSCIVMDPDDGSIIAMAETPSYDLNNIPRDDVTSLFKMSKSSQISSVYEPGSTFKILTTAIGLDTAKISRNYNFFCPGYRIIDGQRIKCWRTIGHGSETFDQGVQNSCNCLFMDIAGKVGSATFYQYMREFGLDQKTGVDLQGEASGLLIKEDTVKTVDMARIGFGQAVAVTPIELVTAVASVINGGTSVTPHLMDKVIDSDGNVVAINNTKETKRIIKENTSTEVRQILGSVVSNGSGRNASIEGYQIGGKTGTAQKYQNGSIARGKYVSSFIGFLGVEHAEYLTLFIVDEPEGYVYYGSLVAAPYVKNIFEGIIAYKGIPSSKVEEVETVTMPNVIGLSIVDATERLKSAGLQYELSGEEGVVDYQFPNEGEVIKRNSVVLIKVE